jgi:hypothetical protein
MQPQQVKLPSGEILTYDHMVPKLEWWANGHTLQSDMKVLPLGPYDAILGYGWLKMHSPMICHWEDKTLQFVQDGRDVLLKGLVTTTHQSQEMPATQLTNWVKGNDVWTLAVIEAVSEPLETINHPTVQALLEKYQDMFQAPTTLPPTRFYDHQIPLLPNAIPVNARPYKYSPHHKTEIEKQVKELLEAGLITRSSSPFASPVLLVLKKDGSWRFCVDYRKLNAITMKNRFPMLLVDQILDELAGTKFFTKLDMHWGYHQVWMREEDEFKTAFKTHHGHYQFRVMPFCLTNAPATFQCIMNEVLAPFLCKFVMVFLDDILIYSPCLNTHL